MNQPAVSMQGAPEITPQSVIQPAWGFMVTQVLTTGVELDLFTKIDEGRHTAADLAGATDTKERPLRMLLNALCGIGMLKKSADRYELTQPAKLFLSKNSPGYLGGLITFSSREMLTNWAKLTEAVRTGKPSLAIESAEDEGEFFARLVDSLYNLNFNAADAAAQALIPRLPKNAKQIRVLDIGAGSGVWGLAFARQDPRVRVTVVDFPAVIEQNTKRFVAHERAAERFDYLPGSFRDADFGENKYDVAILGHICHSEGEQNTKKLFAKIRRALKPEGQLLIAEFIPDEGRAENTMPLLFAINMLVHTEEGDTYTISEYQQWLQEAGFESFETMEAPSPSPLMIATNSAAQEEQIAA